MRLQKTLYSTTTALILIFSGFSARADSISIVLTQNSQTAPAGSTVTFDATLTNLSSTETLYLNGDSSATSSLLLSVDDSPFLSNAPLSLDPDEVSGSFALFNVIIDPSTPSGTYDFNAFSILGGLDGSSSDTIGTADFSVTVGSTSPVPEPGSGTLALTGLFAIAGMTYLQRCCVHPV